MAKKSSKKGKDYAIVPWDKEEEGGGGGVGRRVKIRPEGDYPAKIVKLKSSASPDKGTPRIEITFQITAGKHDGKMITEDYYLTPKSLFRLRQVIQAVGLKVPSKKSKLPFAKLKNKAVGITITDDKPYEGKIYSQVSDAMDVDDVDAPADEVSDDDDEDVDDEDVEDEDEDEDEEDEDDDDEDEEDEDDEDLEDMDDDEL